MPTKAARTATEAARTAWDNVQPGDIFFTTGGGVVGALIRRGTESPYGHCGVVHDVDPADGTWYTAEAFPDMPPWKPGLRDRERTADTVAAVVRIWRTEQERQAIISKSCELVEAKLPYAWSEIAVIAAANVLPHSWIPNTDLTRAVICSNHVAQVVRAARPDDYERYFRYTPNREWPGGLHYDLQRMLWDDQHSFRNLTNWEDRPRTKTLPEVLAETEPLIEEIKRLGKARRDR